MKRFVLLFALVGCNDITLEALTVAPPGKTAALDADNNVLDVSRGVAMAFECTASGNAYSGPCQDAEITVDDPAIASVYPSYSDALTERYSGIQGPQARTVFVVVGLQEGKTALRVTTEHASADVAVTVEP
jgi:hypothetical protein